ncbi:MAG: hypothetical protein D6794_07490 [Deltaproteobacteria bacterium]|nr:MAG: hypothetical protein D6794_07490 [Deltaproteobacteria bacterium]
MRKESRMVRLVASILCLVCLLTAAPVCAGMRLSMGDTNYFTAKGGLQLAAAEGDYTITERWRTGSILETGHLEFSDHVGGFVGAGMWMPEWPLTYIEFEAGYFSGDIRVKDRDGVPSTLTGDARLIPLVVNLLWLFERNPSARFRPLVGYGIGAVYSVLDTSPSDFGLDGSNGIHLYVQGIVGLETRLTDRLALTTEYRYAGLSKTKVEIADKVYKYDGSLQLGLVGLKWYW